MPRLTPAKTKNAITPPQDRTARNTRDALTNLKWCIDDALRAGNTLEQIAERMGQPWNDVLILEAFPDIARKHHLAPPLSGKNMPRI